MKVCRYCGFDLPDQDGGPSPCSCFGAEDSEDDPTGVFNQDMWPARTNLSDLIRFGADPS